MLSPRLIIASACAVLVVFLLFTTRRTTHVDKLWRSPFPSSSDDRLLSDVFNATLGFQKIFVVSLPSRTDHRDATSLAAAFSGIEVNYIDGVTPDELNMKALPPGGSDWKKEHYGALGSWRAHMNTLRTIVDQNLTSALILEDDVDWDIRLKSQLRDFAKASRLLVQPGRSGKYLDPSFPVPSPDQKAQNFKLRDYENYAQIPTTSPYGDVDKWDLLWLGHCGTRFVSDPADKIPMGRVVIENDETTVANRHFNKMWGGSEIIDDYPDHTRVVTHTKDTTCTLSYAVSNYGARKLLYEFGVREVTAAADIMFRQMCQGDGAHRDGPRKCLAVQPELFEHHRPRGSIAAMSNIGDHGEGFNDVANTPNIRTSVRINFEKLLDGKTDYIDQYPD